MNREGKFFNLDPLGKILMSKVKAIEWSTTPFSLLCLVTSRLVEKVISLGWEGMEVKFEFRRSPIFGKCVSDLWGK